MDLEFGENGAQEQESEPNPFRMSDEEVSQMVSGIFDDIRANGDMTSWPQAAHDLFAEIETAHAEGRYFELQPDLTLLFLLLNNVPSEKVEHLRNEALSVARAMFEALRAEVTMSEQNEARALWVIAVTHLNAYIEFLQFGMPLTATLAELLAQRPDISTIIFQEIAGLLSEPS